MTAVVAQVSNLLYRRLQVGWACDLSGASAMRMASGLEIRDTADWKSALPAWRSSPDSSFVSAFMKWST